MKAVLICWTLILSVLIVGINPAIAQTAVTWNDLQAHTTHLNNPYEHLTKEQTHRLSDLYQYQKWVKDNQLPSDSFEAQEAERLEQLFQKDGIDTQKLLKHVDEAAAYWQSQSQVTNPNLEGESIQLSGYVLPLEEETPGNKNSRVSEFLLVPYVGACIHVPPPPPNQIVHIRPETPIKNPGVFSAVLATGTLRTNISNYELFQVDGSRDVEVSYAMEMEAIAAAPSSNAPEVTGAWWQTLPARISNVLTVSLGNLSSQTTPWKLMVALLLSFSYGVLHTLGPGHGKAVIVSYFVGHNGSLQRGIAMGVRIAVFHVLSAVVIAVLTHTILQQLGGNSAGSYRIIRLMSYGAIALIGVRMLQQALRTQNRALGSLSNSDAAASKPLNTKADDRLLYSSLSEQIQSSSPKQAVAVCSCLTCDERRGVGGWLALAVGAVPCSGAMLVLLYGLANSLLWPSVMMVVAISVGMAFTLGWIGVFAIMGNRYGQKLAVHHQQKSSGSNNRKKSRFSWTLSGQIVGASCVSLLGIGLFFVTLLTTG